MRNGVTPTCTNFSLRAATENLSVRLLNHLVNIDQASGPRMPRIKKLVLRDPVGVPSSCCTTTSGRTGHWTKMHQSLVKFSESEASNHMPSLADFTTTMPELKFSVHTVVYSMTLVLKSAPIFSQQAPRYLIRDRDGAYGELFVRRLLHWAF